MLMLKIEEHLKLLLGRLVLLQAQFCVKIEFEGSEIPGKVVYNKIDK